jgi:hypothetical protein
MKGKSLLSFGFTLVIWVAGSCPVLSQSERSRQTFQNLPNGLYLYGESPRIDREGSYYFVLRKTGNAIIGMSYTGMERSECFRGTVNQNTINNMTVAEIEPNSAVGWQFIQNEAPMDLTQLHQIGSDKISPGVRGLLQECIRLFANRR